MMPFKKKSNKLSLRKLYLFPPLLCIVCILQAQTIKYSDFLPGYTSKFNFYVVGKVGNTIQVWRTPKNLFGVSKNNSTANIYIFSQDMKLIGEKIIKLDGDYQLPVSLNFRLMGNVYDASINYLYGRDIVKRDLWRIGEDGNSIDYTSGTVAVNDSANHQNDIPIQQSTINASEKSVIQVFTAKNKSEMDSLHKSDDLLVVQQIYDDTLKEGKQIQFKAIMTGFGRPGFIKGDNSSFWVFAIKKPDSSDISIEHISDRLSIFVAKLDSNLNVVSTAAKFLDIKLTEFSYKINYWIQNAFSQDNSLYLICLGARPYMYSERSGQQLMSMVPPFSNEVRDYPVETLDILQIDDSIKCKSDLSLAKDIHSPQLFLLNSFYSQFGSDAYYFISEEIRNNLQGIKVFHITGAVVKEMNILTEPHYKYAISDTYRLDQHHFLIPFYRNGKFGFMLWSDDGL